MPLVSITRSSDDASVYTYRKDKASCFDSRLILAEDQKIPSLCLEDVVSADTFPIGTNVFVRRSDGLYKFDKKGLIATSIVLQKNNYEFAELGEFYSNSVSGDSCRLIHLRQSQIVDTSFVGTMLKLPCNNSISSYNSDDRFILLTFDHDTIQLSVLTK